MDILVQRSWQVMLKAESVYMLLIHLLSPLLNQVVERSFSSFIPQVLFHMFLLNSFVQKMSLCTLITCCGSVRMRAQK